MNAWADGLNYYLHKHPAGEAARDHALRAVDGADLQRGQHRRRHREGEPRRSSRRSTARRRAEAAARSAEPPVDFVEPTGSNGVAIAPSNTAAHHALLLINPHTSFFFRAEAQMVSDEGLNAYGALTWGQFFIYQGFNDRAGWMHTSSGVDNIDEYLETVTKKGDGFTYKYGTEERPVTTQRRSSCRTRRASGHGAEGVHRLPHASRPDRARGRRQVGQHPADAGAAEGAARSRTRAPRRRTTRRSARRWSCTPTRRTTRSTPTPTATSPTSTPTSSRSATRSSTGPSRWTAAIPRPSGTACCRSTRRRPAEPGERLALQHEQLAVVGGRPEQPEEGGLSRRTSSAATRRARAASTRIRVLQRQEGLHARLADRRGVRQLPAGVRRADAARSSRRTTRLPASNPLKAKLAEQIALLRDVGLPLVGRLGADVARGVLGRGARRRVGDERARPASPRRLHGEQATPRAAAAGARRRVRQARRRLRQLEDAVGRHQPLPAPDRRHRPAVQRRRRRAFRSASPRRAGARWRRSARAPIQGHEEDVRHHRQQLRRRRRVRRQRAGAARSPPAARAATRTSPHFNDQAVRYAPATCATSTSTRSSSRSHGAHLPSGRQQFAETSPRLTTKVTKVTKITKTKPNRRARRSGEKDFHSYTATPGLLILLFAFLRDLRDLCELRDEPWRVQLLGVRTGTGRCQRQWEERTAAPDRRTPRRSPPA